MSTAFRILKATTSVGHPVGTVCYRLACYDYGCASEDSRMTGVPHVSMTLSPEGDYPSFTVPEEDLEVAP